MRSLLLMISFVATLPLSAQRLSPALFSGLPTNMKQTVITQVSQTCNANFTSCTNDISGNVRSFLAAFGVSTYDGSGNAYSIVTDKSPNLQNLYVTDPSGNATLLGTLPNSGGPACTQHGNTATYDFGVVLSHASDLDADLVTPNPIPFFFFGLPSVVPYSYNQAVNALYVITTRRIVTFQTSDANFCTTGNGATVSQTTIYGLITITMK